MSFNLRFRKMPGMSAMVALALLFVSARVFATTYLKPGDDGSIEVVITNASNSIGTAEDVELSVDAPAYFSVGGGSVLGPIDIQKGQSQTFVVDYTIDGGAPDGSFNVVLQATSTASSIDSSELSAGFKIDAADPTEDPKSSTGTPVTPKMNPNQCLVLHSSSTGSGIKSVEVFDSSNTSLYREEFTGCPTEPNVFTGICSAEPGDYHIETINCAGTPIVSTITATDGSLSMVLYSTWPNASTHISGTGIAEGAAGTYDLEFYVQATIWNPLIPNDNHTACLKIATTIGGESSTGATECFEGKDNRVTRKLVLSSSGTRADFNISNATDTVGNFDPRIEVHLGPYSIGVQDVYNLQPGEVISGYVDLPQTADSESKSRRDASTITVTSPVAFLSIATSSLSDQQSTSATRRLLRLSSPHRIDITADGGLFVVGATTMTYEYEYLDTVATDTGTLRLYAWENASWSSAPIWGQAVSVNAGTITVVGISSITWPFASFFDGQDSSAPVTSISVVGSTFVFDGSVFLSTDSLVVLASTDPVVDGFHSGLATVSYRVDPRPGDAWIVYTSSIPLTEGTHFVQYRAQDYAGNLEAVQTATYTVTAGDVFRDSGGMSTEAAVLVGFLDSGARFEVEARTQNDYVLRTSSADGTAMTSLDNIGNWGLGTDLAAATIEIDGAATDGAVALQLRSGNSTGSLTSSQIALGYDGETSMRHLVKTQHFPSGAQGNKMRFLVWSPAVGSTAAVANTTVLSLESISNSSGAVHIMPPSVGLSSANLTVSDGATLGGGSILVANTVVPSSIEFKADVEPLGAAAHEQAYADVLALRHADYRYRSEGDGTGPLRRGLIYEDAPASIHGPGKSLSFDQRLVNVEMAIQTALSKYESLLNRLDGLRESRR